jgi:hypothetical protein
MAADEAVVWPLVSGCATLDDRVHAVPAVEATSDSSSQVVRPCVATAPRLCGRGGARRGGAGTVMVERKAGGRCGREGGVREPRQSRSRSAIAVMRDFF